MDNFDKKIKQIKIYRSVDAFLDDLFINSVIYYDNVEGIYEPSKYYFYNDEFIVFEYQPHTNTFYYSYRKIDFVLKNKYKCTYNQISDLLYSRLTKFFNISKNVVLCNLLSGDCLELKKQLIIRHDTRTN